MPAVTGKTDSIHLSPQRIDDNTDGIIAGDCVVRVANVKLDRHGDLTLVAREAPAVEGDICGFHGWWFAVGFTVGFPVGSARRFVVGLFWHDQMFVCGRVMAFIFHQSIQKGLRRRLQVAMNATPDFESGKRIEHVFATSS